MEVLVGFVNALSQFVLVGWIIYEAVTRLLHPGPILSGVMLVVALAGLLVHALGDLLGSLAAVLAALAIRWFGWLWADPLLSLLVSLLILGNAWQLLRRSAHILLEGVPEGVDSAVVEQLLRGADPAIRSIHHLHVWQLASGSRMATLHAELNEPADGARVLQAIRQILRERF